MSMNREEFRMKMMLRVMIMMMIMMLIFGLRKLNNLVMIIIKEEIDIIYSIRVLNDNGNDRFYRLVS